MSTPAGQSRRAALAGQAQVERLGDLGAPRSRATSDAVGHLLQHPRAAAGGVLLVPGGQVGRAHHAAGRRCGRPGTCRRRRSGAPRRTGRRRRGSRRSRARGASGRACGTRRSASSGAGSTSTPGLSRSSGSKMRLDRGRTASIASAEYMTGSSSLRARPSPCSPDIEPPYAADQLRRVDHERAVAAPARSRSGKSMRHVHAAVAEVAVAQSVQAVLGHERGEVTQVRAQLPGRDGGVLPAGPGRRVRPGCGRRRPAPSSRMRHSAARRRRR